MSRSELTPFSYAVLVLVGEGGAGPHDLVRMMRQGRVYWTAAESHYYSEPKRLERLGYLESEKQPGKTRERTHYRLTEQGRRALAEWLAQPASFPRIQNEAVVRVLAGDLVDDAVLLESLQGLRDEIEDLRSRLDIAEDIAKTLPHRERYLRLVRSLGRRTLQAHEEWLAEVERELG
jgi:DNA-binding PadR family transcriptional regulator